MAVTPAANLPTVTFDTTDFAPADRFRAWASHNGASRFTQTGTGPFEARASVWVLDDLIVSEHRTDAFNGHRDRQMAKAAPVDHVMLIFPFEGWTRVYGDGLDVTCGPGDICFLDYRRPLATENSRQHGAAISLRRDLLEDVVGPVSLHGRVTPSPEADVLIQLVRSLTKSLPETRVTSVPLLSRILRDLIAAAVGEDASADQGPARQEGLRGKVLEYMKAMPAGELDPDTLAQNAGITRSTLYRLFRADGGVLAFDRKRRLGQVHRALSSGDRRSFSVIGAEAGFDDAAHLAHAFRRRYGYSMTSLRQKLLPPSLPAAPATETVALYREAVRDLSQ